MYMGDEEELTEKRHSDDKYEAALRMFGKRHYYGRGYGRYYGRGYGRSYGYGRGYGRYYGNRYY